MLIDATRRRFLLSAPLAALASSLPAAALTPDEASNPEPFHHFTAESLEHARAAVEAKPGNDNLLSSAGFPLTIVLTTEEKKAAKEFEFHEHRDHVFQILAGTTTYELGGTPVTPRNTKPGEWLAPASTGAQMITLHKGDMLVIPRGMAHKRTTQNAVTFLLISDTPPAAK